MISAGLDDELGREEREHLDQLLAWGDEHSARECDFRNVDEELRSLAAAPIADERLSRMLATFRTRLETDQPSRTISRAPGEHSSIAMRRWRRWGFSSALAAAAAFVVYLVLSSPEPLTEESSPLAESVASLAEEGAEGADSALEPEEELALALGYGDEMSELGAISNDDLDVIERLDLLDYLSARETKESG